MADLVNEVLADYERRGDGVLELWRYDLTVEQVVEVVRAVRDLRVFDATRLDESLGSTRGRGKPLGAAGVFAIAQHVLCRPELQSLRLSGNRIGTDGLAIVAGTIGEISKLEEIELSYNDLEPASISDFSRAISRLSRFGKLQNLNAIDLSWNRLGPESVSEMLMALDGTPKLKSVKLDGTSLGHGDGWSLAKALHKLTKINWLSLSSNDIKDHDITRIAWAIGNMNELRALDLSRNQAHTQGTTKLAESLQDCHSLEELNIRDNLIGHKAAVSLSSALAGKVRLKKLYIGCNQVLPEGGIALGAVLHTLRDLEDLDLEANSLGVEGASAISAAMCELHHVQRLYLGSNGIGSYGVKSLCSGLASRSSVCELSIPYNNIKADGSQYLAELLNGMDGLRAIDISGNRIHSNVVGVFWEALCKLQKLEVLNVSNNMLGHDGAVLLASKIRFMSNLKRINVANNAIGSSGARSIVNELSGCRQIEQVILDGNQIEELSWLREINDSFSARLRLNDNQIMLPGEVVATEDWRLILRAWLGATAQLPLMKVVLLGEGEAGKTSLAACLRKQEPPKTHDPTRAFDVHVVKLGPAKAAEAMPPQVRLFDFGGQRHLQGLHRFFLSSRRNVFVVVVRADRTLAENRLWHWLGVVQDVYQREVMAERERAAGGRAVGGDDLGEVAVDQREQRAGRWRAGLVEVDPPPVLVVVTHADAAEAKIAEGAIRRHLAAFTGRSGVVVEFGGMLRLKQTDDGGNGKPAERVAGVRTWLERHLTGRREVQVRVHPAFVTAVERLTDAGGMDNPAPLTDAGTHRVPRLMDFEELCTKVFKSAKKDDGAEVAARTKVTEEDYRVWRVMLRNLGLLLWVGDRSDLAVDQGSIEDLHGTPELLRRVYEVLWRADGAASGTVRPANAMMNSGQLRQLLVKAKVVSATEAAALIDLLVACSVVLDAGGGQYLIPDLLTEDGDPPPATGFAERCVQRGYVPDWYLPRLIAQQHHNRYPGLALGCRHFTFKKDEQWVGVSMVPREDGPDELVVQRWAVDGSAVGGEA